MKTTAKISENKNLIKVCNITSILKSGLKLTGGIAMLFIVLCGLSGCEENMWLRSEKKIRNQIEGSWNRLFVTSGIKNNETWTFKDGFLVIAVIENIPNSKDDGYIDLNTSDGVDTLILDVGNYSVDAKIDDVYLKLSNLEKNMVESAKQGLNAKWTIVDIDGNILYIAAENGSAIIQREFERK